MMKTDDLSFRPGQRVRAAQNLFNDGTYSEQMPNALLVKRGEAGDVVGVARNEDTGATVYLVEFAFDQIVGCLEWELMPWRSAANRFDLESIAGAAYKGVRGYAAA
ncbi:MAG: nitrogen fixation protein NifZ [Terracidiphilus sp.]